jgi:thymidylate kinase
MARGARHACRTGVVVEIVGPAGAGKTTIAAALDRGAESVTVQGPYRSLRRVPLYARSLMAAAPVLVHARGDRRTSRARVANWLVRTEASKGIVAQLLHPGTIVVLDQGPIYTLARADVEGVRWDGALGRWRRSQLDHWGRRLDVLVILDAPDEVLLGRIRSRAKAHGSKAASDAEASLLFGRYRRAYATLARELRDRGRTLVRTFEPGRVEDLTAKVLAVVTSREAVDR